MYDKIETCEDVSAEEISHATATLAKFKGGFLPFPIFAEVARLTVSAVVEVVPCRLNQEGRIEVLLLQREQNDTLWPGMWHNPGTLIRPTDTEYTFDEAFVRICKEEIGLSEVIMPTYVDNIVHQTLRGMDMARIYYLELNDAPKGMFIEVDALPDNVIAAQAEVIRIGAAAFAESKNKTRTLV